MNRIIALSMKCVKKINYKNIKENYDVKILNLVLFSHNKEYDDMYRITRDYYRRFSNVTTIYYTFSESIDGSESLRDDILYLHGKESYIPGILDKTMKAFSYGVKTFPSYDYIVRSNISSIINFSLLQNNLRSNPIQYGGGLLLTYSINGNDIVYASGTSIIIGMALAKELCKKTDKARYDIIDDVAIGALIKEYFPTVTPVSIGHFALLPNMNGVCNLQHLSLSDTIFYRNRSSTDRNIDVQQMKCIVDSLLKVEEL
jgi:hypothetical protein